MLQRFKVLTLVEYDRWKVRVGELASPCCLTIGFSTNSNKNNCSYYITILCAVLGCLFQIDYKLTIIHACGCFSQKHVSASTLKIYTWQALNFQTWCLLICVNISLHTSTNWSWNLLCVTVLSYILYRQEAFNRFNVTNTTLVQT